MHLDEWPNTRDPQPVCARLHGLRFRNQLREPLWKELLAQHGEEFQGENFERLRPRPIETLRFLELESFRREEQ